MSGNGHGNTLGGGPPSDPPPSTWGRPSAPRIGRIGDWDNTPSIVHDDGREDDDDDDTGPPREGESWFAGGERRYAHAHLYLILQTSTLRLAVSLYRTRTHAGTRPVGGWCKTFSDVLPSASSLRVVRT